jgi:hypothetical protein
MAKILFSGVAGVDMRNKLNGSVFSKNRYGGYVRTKVTPVNPQTTSQQNARNRLSTQSQAWRGLTESQRQSWIDGALNFPTTDIYGNTKILSGQALYVKLNTNLSLLGLTSIDDCPAPVAIPALSGLIVNADSGVPSLSVEWDQTPVPADFAVVIFATGNVTPGKSFVKNLFRFITFVDEADTSPASILAEWNAVHGTLVINQKVFVKAFFMSKITGQVGIPLQAVQIAA